MRYPASEKLEIIRLVEHVIRLCQVPTRRHNRDAVHWRRTSSTFRIFQVRKVALVTFKAGNAGRKV